MTPDPQTPPLALLQLSVKDLVDKNVEGLPGRLLHSFQGMSWTPLGAPADPGSTLLHAEQLQRTAAKTSRKTSSANPGVDPQPDG